MLDLPVLYFIKKVSTFLQRILKLLKPILKSNKFIHHREVANKISPVLGVSIKPLYQYFLY